MHPEIDTLPVDLEQMPPSTATEQACPREVPSTQDAPMLTELQKLAVAQQRVEGALRSLRKEQQHVCCELSSIRKDLASLLAKISCGSLSAESEATRKQPKTSHVLPASADWASVQVMAQEAHLPLSPSANLEPEDAVVAEATEASEAPFSPPATLEPEDAVVAEATEASEAPGLLGQEEEGSLGSLPSGKDDIRQSFVAQMLPVGWPTVVAVRTSFEALERAPSCRLVRAHFSASNAATLARCRTAALNGMGHSDSTHSGMGHSDSSHSGIDSTVIGLFGSWRSATQNDGLLSRVMMRPNSVFRGFLDVLSCIAVFYDLTVVPYALAWDVQLEGALYVLAWIMCLFWTLEMGTHFMTGFNEGNMVQLKPRLVALHYLRTWFVPDLLLLTVDWLCVNLAPTITGRRTAPWQGLFLVKFGRLIRMLMKWRAMKFVVIIEQRMESSMDEFQRTSLRILVIIVGTLWLNHLICCTWFAVGRSAPSDTGMRWVNDVRVLGDLYVEFLEAPPSYQYASAFHWSLAQLASGEIEIACSNTVERLFNILCLVVGLLFSSTLVSSLSAAMVDVQILMREKRTKLMKLRRYLVENAVNRRVAVRVQQQAVERLGHKARLMEQDVTAIALLSSSLRARLHFEICRPHLVRHPLFRLMTTMDETLANGLCREAVQLSFLRNQDDLFIAGTSSDTAYYIMMGEVTYSQDPESSPVKEREVTTLCKETWLSEASLWSHWTHVGSAEAFTICQVLRVSADGLVQTLARHPSMHEISREYCRQFHRRIISAKPPDAPWPNDLHVPFTDYGDLVTSMDKDIQATIGLCALDELTEPSTAWPSFARTPSLGHWDKLREEVVNGTSLVMMTGQGQLERVVSVVALHAQDTRGFVLAQLGKLDEGGAVKAECQLPGGKIKEGELTRETLQRVLNVKLKPLVNSLEIIGTERHVEVKLSKEHHIKTKYLRTVCSARLVSPMHPTAIALSAEPAPNTTTSSRFATSAVELPLFRRQLLERKFYGILNQGCEVVYAWIEPQEREHLSSAEGEADLAWLLSSLAADIERLPERRAKLTHMEL